MIITYVAKVNFILRSILIQLKRLLTIAVENLMSLAVVVAALKEYQF